MILSATREGAVAVLELARPEARNALNEELMSALAAELEGLAADDSVRAVVLTGAGGHFCAGADITAFDRLRAEPLLGENRAGGGPMWRALDGLAKPIIAAVEGFALGGGCEIALACDIVIAGRTATFGVPEVKLGVIPGAGGTQRLIRAVGKSKAMAMLLTGDLVDAERAERAGLVAEVVDAGAALEHANAMAARIARNSPLAVALAKDAAQAALESPLARGLEHERRNFVIALNSDDCHEGQAAFLAKRAPTFHGR